MDLFASINYKMYVSVRKNPQEMNMVKCNIDTSAGPNLVKTSFQLLTWASRAKSQDFLKLRGANEQTISSKGVILLNI